MLLPLYDNRGRAFPPSQYTSISSELTERFGGLTAYTRAPAKGLWTEGDGSATRDDIVVYEVMVDAVDHAWWNELRIRLERQFEQEELVIRAMAIERL